MEKRRSFHFLHILGLVLGIGFFVWEMFIQAEPVYISQKEATGDVRMGLGLAPFPPSKKQFFTRADDTMKGIKYHVHFVAPYEETEKWIAKSEGLKDIVPKRIDVNSSAWPKECKWAGTGMGIGKLYNIPEHGNWIGGFLCMDPLLGSVYLQATLDL